MIAGSRTGRRTALRFVLLIGVVSFFADFTYEGARSVTGPFLAILGASGAVVSGSWRALVNFWATRSGWCRAD